VTTAARLREDALACIHAAIAAVEPEALVRSFLEQHPDLLEVPGAIHLAGIGKAGAAMARGAAGVLGDSLASGALIVPAGQEAGAPEGIETFGGGHPVPNEEGVRGAERILALAEGLTENDLLLCVISGGGSALMTLPPAGISLDDLRATTQLLLEAGATIDELNAVRKHLDRLKGGRLARAAAPARVLALILSDVVGDPLNVIASGPVSPDPTSYVDALAVLDRYDLRGRVPATVRDHLERGERGEKPESPGPGDPAFAKVRAKIVGNNILAAKAAEAEAKKLGYNTKILTTTLTGEAREVGRRLAQRAHQAVKTLRENDPVAPPACLIAAGETTVTVTGKGKGGRNQEVALGAAIALDKLLTDTERDQILIASAGTDGIDGPTDAAGAMATGSTVRRATAKGRDAQAALADNDTYPFFESIDDLILTGPTGTNVMDLQMMIVGKSLPG
jgi:hydroxypyruvate reductase